VSTGAVNASARFGGIDFFGVCPKLNVYVVKKNETPPTMSKNIFK
jgi:hypothetical protein